MASTAERDSYIAAGWLFVGLCVSALITWLTGHAQQNDQFHGWAALINGLLFFLAILGDFAFPVLIIRVKARIGIPLAVILFVIMILPFHTGP